MRKGGMLFVARGGRWRRRRSRWWGGVEGQHPDLPIVALTNHCYCLVFLHVRNVSSYTIVILISTPPLTHLFTEDATLVTDTGVFYGQEDIGKYQTGLFKVVRFSNHKADPISAYPMASR
jgi:hypothetical protein